MASRDDDPSREELSEGTSSTRAPYRVPGQFSYDGAEYCGLFKPEVFERMKTFEYDDQDIVVATYPKSGTTWMAEIVYLLMHDSDTEAALSKHIGDRCHFIDAAPPGHPAVIDKLDFVRPPRIIRTHQTRSIFDQPLTECQTKFIIVLRNIKDILVSYYHFYKAHVVYGKFPGSFNDYFELFRHNQINQGDWFDWILGWWREKDNPNVMFVYYEDMVSQLDTEIKRVAQFLNKDVSDADMDKICRHVAFDSMKDNPQCNLFGDPDVMDYSISPFIRKGVVGDWKEYFTQEQSDYVDDLHRKRIKDTGLSFRFE